MTLVEQYEDRYRAAWLALCAEEKRQPARPSATVDHRLEAIKRTMRLRRDAVKRLRANGLMVKEIAERLEWSVPTITEDLKQLRAQGEIS